MSEQTNNNFPHCYFADLKIYQCGIQKCEPTHTINFNNLDNFTFHYVLSGTGTFNIEMNGDEHFSQQIDAGQGFLISPNQKASCIADENNPWQYAYIEFGGVRANDVVAQSGLTQPIYVATDIDKQNIMQATLLHIISNPETSMYELMGHFYIFISALIESNINRKLIKRSGLQDFYVQEIINFVEKNSHKNVQVEDVAEFFKLDRAHVSRMFKNHMNITLRKFLAHCRMNKACDLLKTTTKTLDQISDALGYSNTFNFSRAFKSFIGTSPSQWRAKNRLT